MALAPHVATALDAPSASRVRPVGVAGGPAWVVNVHGLADVLTCVVPSSRSTYHSYCVAVARPAHGTEAVPPAGTVVVPSVCHSPGPLVIGTVWANALSASSSHWPSRGEYVCTVSASVSGVNVSRRSQPLPPLVRLW